MAKLRKAQSATSFPVENSGPRRIPALACPMPSITSNPIPRIVLYQDPSCSMGASTGPAQRIRVWSDPSPWRPIPCDSSCLLRRIFMVLVMRYDPAGK